MTCPGCGAVVTPVIHTYGGSPKRAVCPECGTTIRTFITGVDWLLMGVTAAILLAGLIALL